ncbi:MAG TPA: CDP-alcohol phosphatidyltransferase family protein [Candidatus Krumholzibacteria bacterium]|nr:CDP-alcohol phosphatidyltransferase family protein [Candidatus Krumholzibacteria bacterium]
MPTNVTIPNLLTVVRIVLAALGAWLGPVSGGDGGAVWVLIVAAVLDAFDGWYARAFSQSTSLGKHLDPFADKVLVTVILVWVGMDAASAVVWSLIGVALAREAAMTLLRMHSARRRRRLIPASRLGRLKMFLQCTGGLTILGVTHMLGRQVPAGVVAAALAGMLAVSLAAMVGYLKAKGSAADHEQTHFALRSPG